GGNLSETALEDNLLGCLSAELVSLEAEIDLTAGMDLSAETDLPARMGLSAEIDLPAGMGLFDERPAKGLGDTGGVLPAEAVGVLAGDTA
nr:hypothetical protein [Tanacetum cinerariifolium]